MSGSDPGYRLAGCGAPCTWTTGDIYTIAGNGGFFNGDMADPRRWPARPRPASGSTVPEAHARPRRQQSHPADCGDSDSRGNSPPSTPPIGATVTVPSDAAWTTQIYNASSIPAHNVVVTIGATANGATNVVVRQRRDQSRGWACRRTHRHACPAAVAGAPPIGDIPAVVLVVFTTFVSTAGRAVGDAITEASP